MPSETRPAITSAAAQVWCLHDGSLQAVRTADEPLATKGRKTHATARTVETLSDPEALHAAIRECAVSGL